LGDGEPNVELRYKKGTDPYEAAQQFILNNKLPLSYLDEIAQYIIENIPEARQAVNKKSAAAAAPPGKALVDGEKCDRVFEVTLKDGRVLELPYNKGEDVNWAVQRFVERHNLPMGTWASKCDRVFEVTLKDGRVLELPYNKGEDVNWAVQRFVERHNLPMGTWASLVRFLQEQLAEAEGNSHNDSARFSDPFVEGRYVPGAGSSSKNTSNGASGFIADPYTGENAYVTTERTVLPSANAQFDKKRPRSDLVPLEKFFRLGIEQPAVKAIARLKEENEKQSVNKLSVEQ
uniref:SEP domain-containing protein n=1 Tax=Gongylonema pulchrum TaxID=637853 RepID=A0A183E687_9BILA